MLRTLSANSGSNGSGNSVDELPTFDVRRCSSLSGAPSADEIINNDDDDNEFQSERRKRPQSFHEGDWHSFHTPPNFWLESLNEVDEPELAALFPVLQNFDNNDES